MYRRPFRRTLALAALAGALTVAGTAASTPAAAFSTVSNVRLNAVEARLVSLINAARTARGIRALVVAPGTTDFARRWAMTQATQNRLYHNPGLAVGVERHGSANWHAVAENVGRASNADSLFTAYMNSPGHRANILDPALRYLGIGWVERPDGSGYNTQVFVDQYSGTYGRTRVPAVGGLADHRTPTSRLNVGSFENGWDARVHVVTSGAGFAASRPVFETPTTGDQSVRFSVRETARGTGGGSELRIRDALDLRQAESVTVRLGANTASGRPIRLEVRVLRELGNTVTLGAVTVASGRFVTVTLPLPAGAKNFRNVVSVVVTRAALDSLSATLSGRSVQVRVADVVVNA